MMDLVNTAHQEYSLQHVRLGLFHEKREIDTFSENDELILFRNPKFAWQSHEIRYQSMFVLD